MPALGSALSLFLFVVNLRMFVCIAFRMVGRLPLEFYFTRTMSAQIPFVEQANASERASSRCPEAISVDAS